MPLNFKNRDLISIKSLSKEEILHILTLSKELKNQPQSTLLDGKIMGSCFFEPSTRTRLSFEAAMHRLGGKVIGFTDAASTSTAKGEAFSDTIKTIGHYTDVMVVRHHLEGAAKRASEVSETPIINGGDGTNQHPTQTLLDLFTIQVCHGALDNVRIAIIGDLKHGRTVHSLAQACTHFNSRLYFVSPKGLEMPPAVCHELSMNRIKFSLHNTIEEVIEKADILYMTRIQEERFSDKSDYQRVKDSFVLTSELLKAKGHSSLRVLHPFPRRGEINFDVDNTPYAYYFQQAANGLYVRQAILGLILGKLS
jgi:aspartate carbamoyltransferase catalytic subunit